MRRVSLIAILFVTLLVQVVGRAGVVSYSVTDLGTFGGTGSQAADNNSINASGQVVGIYITSGVRPPYFAFRTGPNGIPTPGTDLATLIGVHSYASGINDSGQTVGYFDITNGPRSAFRTDANGDITAATDLGSFGGSDSEAYAINASGQAVGYSADANGVYHAFRTTTNGTIDAASDLGTLGGPYSFAYGINTSGQAVGEADTGTGRHPFRTTANGNITAASDLGTLGGSFGAANDINDLGQAVGYSSVVGGDIHAFRTTSSGIVDAGSDLGTLGGARSYAISINNWGQVVGHSYTTGTTIDHAFFVDAAGPMIDLNTLIAAGSGWLLSDATGINDAGQISGTGTIDGQVHAYLLTPVPEPEFISVLVLLALLAKPVRGRVKGLKGHKGVASRWS